MKKKIVILGSTGSIGMSTLDVIKRNKKNFDVILLSANNNYKKLIEQAKRFDVKNVLIKNQNYYSKVKNSLQKTKVYAGDVPITNIISGKIDYTMSAIVGLAGLQPTVDAIKISKTVAIANKETIICGWEVLSKYIKKYKTKILPVDSEHFSIMELTKGVSDDEIEEIIITVFEVIEACKIFKFNRDKYRIMIHPQSYVHSIIRFKNGLIKMILYNTDMKIPISNTLYGKKNYVSNIKKIDTKILNKMSFQNVNTKHFPSVKLITRCLNSGLLAPTIVNASNEILVNLFLAKKIEFLDIVKTINKIFKDKDFKKYATRNSASIKEIKMTDNWARLKTFAMCVK